MNEPTDWVSAIAILASGLILGGLLLAFYHRRKSAPRLGGEPDLDRKDLEAKREALVRQLRDLDENTTAEERGRLELETAGVLRELDSYGAPPPAEPIAAHVAGGMSPAVKGFLWGAASFAALAALGYFVMQSSTPRQDGGSLTGGETAQPQRPMQPQASDPVVMQLEAAVQGDPNNLALRNDLAQAYLERDNLMAVFEQTSFVLQKAPGDSRALTFQALVRMAMGEGALAKQMLEAATKSDPKNLDSWVALAWIYAQEDRLADSESMIAEAVRQSPGDKARLEQIFAQMKQHVEEMKAQPQTQVAEGSGLPAGHPPVDGVPPEERSVRVTLELDPSAPLKTGILFVMARNPMGGPPVAVKRLQVSSFPITFDLGSADSMMGQPLPDSFRLEARLDADGDAATKTPNDPSAAQDGVTPGATVTLALK